MAQIVDSIFQFVGPVADAVTFVDLINGVARICVSVGILKYSIDAIFMFARTVRRGLL